MELSNSGALICISGSRFALIEEVWLCRWMAIVGGLLPLAADAKKIGKSVKDDIGFDLLVRLMSSCFKTLAVVL